MSRLTLLIVFIGVFQIHSKAQIRKGEWMAGAGISAGTQNGSQVSLRLQTQLLYALNNKHAIGILIQDSISRILGNVVSGRNDFRLGIMHQYYIPLNTNSGFCLQHQLSKRILNSDNDATDNIYWNYGIQAGLYYRFADHFAGQLNMHVLDISYAHIRTINSGDWQVEDDWIITSSLKENTLSSLFINLYYVF